MEYGVQCATITIANKYTQYPNGCSVGQAQSRFHATLARPEPQFPILALIIIEDTALSATRGFTMR